MKLFQQIFNRFKEILFIPRNLANISRQSNNLIGLENKLQALNQKLNDLDLASISKKLDTLSQNLANDTNTQKKESGNIEISELFSKIQEGFENQFLQFESLLSIYNSLPNLKFLPATRGWAGSPDFLAKIVELILKEKPRFVLEASSGVSTVLIGLTLKSNNFGTSLSLDHDSYYAETTRENLEVNTIGNISAVKHCPLYNYIVSGQDWKWYQTESLNLTEKIDMLIIDGPPRKTQNLARYPAIPLLHEYFSDRVLILIDDAKRNDEIIIVEKWIKFLESNGYHVNIKHYNNYEKGMVILESIRL
ncbi:MAG: class I SAM-dependent methyltransferase [Sphingobacteriales bacterium]|nr:class I SAM-dependent methyltransferase [Sphingobacteriales bacterium]